MKMHSNFLYLWLLRLIWRQNKLPPLLGMANREVTRKVEEMEHCRASVHPGMSLLVPLLVSYFFKHGDQKWCGSKDEICVTLNKHSQLVPSEMQCKWQILRITMLLTGFGVTEGWDNTTCCYGYGLHVNWFFNNVMCTTRLYVVFLYRKHPISHFLNFVFAKWKNW